MADQLEIDLEFRPNTSEAQAALDGLNRTADDLARSVEGAFDGIAASLSSAVDLGGLEAAAGAISQLQGVDLSSVDGAAAALIEATGPADQIAAALAEASVNAEGIAVVVDAAPAEQLAAALGEASAAAVGVGDGIDPRAFLDAADTSEQLTLNLASAAEDAVAAATAVGDVASSLAQAADDATTAAEAMGGLSDSADETSESQDEVQESVQGTTESQKESNEETRKGVDLAGLLKDQFGDVYEVSTGLGAPIKKVTDHIVEAVKALEGFTGVVTGGLAAGAIGLLSAGAQYKSASDTITLATGATGGALEDLQDSFDTTLRTSGRSATDLATILAQLSRDTGATGDELAKLTTKTAGFLKVTSGSVSDVRSLTQAMKALGLGAADTVLFQDQLAASQKAFGGNISSLLSQIQTAGPILSTLGFDPGQIAAFTAQFDSAGLSTTRFVPGLTKLAQTAASEGKTASEAFGDLIERVDQAASSTAALDQVQGIFNGRNAAQFVQGVRNGTISVERLNEVLTAAPGTISRLGDATKGLSGQFGAIRNELLLTFGQAGTPVLEGLRKGVEDLRPTLRSLFDVLGTLTPAFKGFAEGVLLPFAALQILETPLSALAAVLDQIPEPVLEVVGVFAALHVVPFGAIANGVTAIGKGISGLVASARGLGTADAAFSKLGGTLGGINLVALAAAAGLVAVTTIMQNRADNAREMKERVDALAGAFTTLTTSTAAAIPKIEELLAKGDEGGIISDGQLANVAALGATIKQVAATAEALATGDRASIESLTRQIVALEKASIASGQAFRGDGLGLGKINEAAAGTKAAIRDIVAGINEQAKAQLDQLLLQEKITAADRVRATVALGLKDETEGEARVRDFLVSELNRELAAKAGLATADDAETQRRGEILGGLEEEGLLRDQVVAASGRQAQVLNDLAAASRSGVASDEDRVKIVEKLVESGLEEGEALQALARAEQELLSVQEKYTPSAEAMNAALTRTFQLIGQGFGTWDALSEAAQETGVAVNELSPVFDAFNSALEKIAPAAEASDRAMSSLIRSQAAGLSTEQAAAALLHTTGNNAEEATVALNAYAQGVDATTKALDGLVPKLGAVIGQLQEGAADAIFGVDADAQIAAIDETRRARLEGLEQEKADIEAAKEVRQRAADDDILLQKSALQEQKRLGEEAAKARGETFDSTAIDLELNALKARVDTADLDAQLESIEQRQQGIDAATERARAALKVFADEEQAIRARASLETSDIDSQIAALERTKQLAVEQATARGALFDPSALDAQIGALQQQRAKISGQLDEDIASAQTRSGQVQSAVEAAAGGLLGFGTVLDTFDAQLKNKLAAAQTVVELRAQGLEDTVSLLFDPELGFSQADQAAFLNQIATMSPEERTALERHAEEVKAQLDKTNAEVEKAGNIFAEPNPENVSAAEQRGKELAKGLADGVVGGLTDERLNEIITVAIQSGADPETVRRFFRDRGKDAGDSAKEGVGLSGLGSVGIGSELVAAVEEQMGLAGTTSGQILIDEAQRAMREGLDPDAAAAMLKPVQDRLPVEGAIGGRSVASAVDEAIRNDPIDPDAAAVLTENLRTQLPLEGQTGGAGYAQGAAAGMALYPIPTEAGTIMVSSVSQALTVAGTDAGANYALSVAAGIAAFQGDAITAAHLTAIRVDEAGHVGLEAASPSKKGLRLGRFWAEGVALGITSGLDDVEKAAAGVGDAVAGIVLDVPRTTPVVDLAAKVAAIPVAVAQEPVLVGVGAPAGTAATTAGGDTNITINATVTGTTNANADEVAEAMSRKIGWLGITGRAEL